MTIRQHHAFGRIHPTILDQKLAAKRLGWSRSLGCGYGIGKHQPKAYPYASARQNSRMARAEARLVATTQGERLTKS